MKKILSIVMILLALVCVLAACEEEQTPIHIHAYGGWTVTLEATCTQAGEKTRSCACGDSETRRIDPIEHAYGEWSTSVMATCSTKGTEVRECSCGRLDERATDMLPHTFTEKVMSAAYISAAATCQRAATYYYKCADCAQKGSETFTGEELGDHAFTRKVKTTEFLKSEANCESPAVYYYRCEHCNEKGETTYTSGNEAHIFTAQVQTAAYLKSAANCQSPAVYYYKCELCEDRGTRTYKVGGVSQHVTNSNHVCTTCRKSYIYFGEYPQTLKADGVTISSGPDSRGYYLGSDGESYAMMYANPFEDGYTFANGEEIEKGKWYYFKVEPICWRVVSAEGDKLTLVCDSVLDCKPYDFYQNNYAQGLLRSWLNEDFYEMAFSEEERAAILTTLVENGMASTGSIQNPNGGVDTYDKIFLLSMAELENGVYSAFSSEQARQLETSDFCRANGAKIEFSNASYGNAVWWMRTPDKQGSMYVWCVHATGSIYCISTVDTGDVGVVPALRISLN